MCDTCPSSVEGFVFVWESAVRVKYPPRGIRGRSLTWAMLLNSHQVFPTKKGPTRKVPVCISPADMPKHVAATPDRPPTLGAPVPVCLTCRTMWVTPLGDRASDFAVVSITHGLQPMRRTAPAM